MEYSNYQSDVFGFVQVGKGHGIIEAVAGSGKTTTIVKALEMTTGSALFLAFNKSISDELSKRIPSHASASTLHAAGNRMVRQSTPKVVTNNFKVDSIMDSYQPTATSKYMKKEERTKKLEVRKVIKSMVSLIKNTLIDYNDSEALYDLADYYGIELESQFIPYVKFVMEESNRISDTVIDFDDMIYLPIYRKVQPSFKYDWVFVDETQDLNKAQLELVLKLVKSTGRIIAVGDPSQSIYGFRGADVDAMTRMKEVLNATELPLSICYRCPTSHLDIARRFVPTIENAPNSKEGEVKHISEDTFVETLISENPEKTLVLSRTNASLVSYSLKLISQGHKAVIKGRDIGKELVSLVKKFDKAETIVDLQNYLLGWSQKEVEKLEQRHHESAIQGVMDKFDCIMNVIYTCETIEDVIEKLKNLFNDDSITGYVFSSIHRAKGLESETVYILNPDKLPLTFKGIKNWERVQEDNICYVAYTRAKDRLVFVKSNQTKS
jgi:superfamily I DNA/RNA helicase